VFVVGFGWGCWVGLGCGFGLVCGCVIAHMATYSRAIMPSVIRIVAVGW
jgi:hypothetical protein